MAAHVLGTGPLDRLNPEDDEHTLAVTGARVRVIGDGAMLMVVVGT